MSSPKKRVRISVVKYVIVVHFSDISNSMDGLLSTYVNVPIEYLIGPPSAQPNKTLNENNTTTTTVSLFHHINTIILAHSSKEINTIYVAGVDGFLSQIQPADNIPLSRFKSHISGGVLNIFVFCRIINSTVYVMRTDVVRNFVTKKYPGFEVIPSDGIGHDMYYVQSNCNSGTADLDLSTPDTALQAEVTLLSHLLFTFPNITDPILF